MARPTDDRTAPPSGDAPPRPWWRRGSVWFAVIAVEVVAALAVSLAFAGDPDEVPLEGADVGRFCADVATFRADAAQQLPLTVETAAGAFASQAEGYRRLATAAPTAVRGDIEQLAEMTDQLTATARELADRRQSDPTTNAVAVLAARQTQLSGPSRRAAERVEATVREACGVAFSAEAPPVTTAAVPPTSAVEPSTAPAAATPTDPPTTAAGGAS